MSRLQDFVGVLRGAQIVAIAAVKHNEAYWRHIWINSSVKEAVDQNVNAVREYADQAAKDPTKQLGKLEDLIKESVERPFVVLEGVRQFIVADRKKTGAQQPPQSQEKGASSGEIRLDAANLDISSITLKELQEIIAEKNQKKKSRRGSAVSWKASPIKEIPQTAAPIVKEISAEPPQEDETYVENILKLIAGKPSDDAPSQPAEAAKNETTIQLPALSSVAKQRKVPSSRMARMASFGSLFASLGVGTINELTKGALGLGGSSNVKEALFSPANTEKIVDTLCKVRGAALKLGQILSIQDSNVVSADLVKAFERVRQAADYMPDWQVEKAMSNEFGHDWRKHFKYFETKPFAAASIGQVHRGVLNDDMEVAIKIQYPGVARSIESDIDNLVGMLKIWDVFPKGFFIDNVVKVAKRELAWEVDYTREAEYTEKFGEMIAEYKEYHVPKVIKHLSTRSVLTTELVPGLPLDKCFQKSYEDRYFIGHYVLKLCLRELFELQCMQTDPNWSNFLYDSTSKRLMLIDFGSTRFYSRQFIQNYRSIIVAAANDQPDKILSISKEMGFLTGYETKQMEDAHVNAVMILGEIFRYDGEFDFGKQSTTKRIAELVPTMVAHRLCPPPEEIYSIHRKLSGIFLLCARLNIKINCRPFYEDIILNNLRK